VDGVKSPETEPSEDRSVVVCDSPGSASTQQKQTDGTGRLAIFTVPSVPSCFRETQWQKGTAIVHEG